ncbi:MAG TPA: hypothetical protein ENL18_04150 [Thermoplasmatales archaeon]|nr:hypothetical protein [Thermoplasmatales archaeon]
MAKVPVKCPNCGKDFEVNENATRGKCPYCKISLVFENVVETPPVRSHVADAGKRETKAAQKKGVVEEKVDISHIEYAVDALSVEDINPRNISDIAAIESIEMENDYLPIEKRVDRILKSRG